VKSPLRGKHPFLTGAPLGLQRSPVEATKKQMTTLSPIIVSKPSSSSIESIPRAETPSSSDPDPSLGTSFGQWRSLAQGFLSLRDLSKSWSELSRSGLEGIVDSKPFELVVGVVVVFSLAVTAFQADEVFGGRRNPLAFRKFLHISDVVLSSLLLGECVLRGIVVKRGVWRSLGGLLHLAIVLLTWEPIQREVFGETISAHRAMTLLRLARGVRLVGVIKRSDNFRDIWLHYHDLKVSASILLWGLAAAFTVIFVFTVIGIALVGSELQTRLDELKNAGDYDDDRLEELVGITNNFWAMASTLIQVSTLDSWSVICHDIQDYIGWAWIFFYSFIVIVVFLAVHLLITMSLRRSTTDMMLNEILLILESWDDSGKKPQKASSENKQGSQASRTSHTQDFKRAKGSTSKSSSKRLRSPGQERNRSKGTKTGVVAWDGRPRVNYITVNWNTREGHVGVVTSEPIHIQYVEHPPPFPADGKTVSIREAWEAADPVNFLTQDLVASLMSRVSSARMSDEKSEASSAKSSVHSICSSSVGGEDVLSFHGDRDDADDAYAAVEEVSLRDVQAEKSSLNDVLDKCSPQCQEAVQALCEKMIDGFGGALFVVINKHHNWTDLPAKFPVKSVDDGKLYRLFKKFSRSCKDQNFASLLEAFSKHSNTDRWELHNLQNLATKLHEDVNDPLFTELVGKPQDGAFIVGSNCRIWGASLQLLVQAPAGEKLQLRKVDCETAGTMHDAGLTAAQWLGLNHMDGAVLVRSDAGGVHVMLPFGDDNDPEVFFLPSRVQIELFLKASL